ncbi:GTPase Era [Caldanaerobacter subterraneus]|uniref:GTPase Era n=2 Tax=Caldanaerobacter subterraneus TaxID=911092 RepID=ERA_CALS4|nr:GTPase Era [Caldanaerobacter subterraneus]Q8RB50.1 RecName: Full=GTPase Era [Caldanaerobacter subterraneus subsp. tengcongensis MB4]AAM24229.1 GTPases [Caldanaerobacter subterraneus subsp. tengcongensis MB4]MCS3916243.1 GTP-binding protein Era [Caldanaerobacter subterraneus subsp. tengcongensis MB4]TCO63902.1 GTP-binding protein Era [Caldanaerobacter subterraneus]
MAYRAGFVALIGRTNVGKSTLLNAILKEKVAITSPKPQTTRNTIRGILTTEDYQIIFVDTPGIHKPKSKLSEFMIEVAKRTLKDVDLILYMVEPDTSIGPGDRYILDNLKEVDTPVILVVNKIDLVPAERVEEAIKVFKSEYNFKDVVAISASLGTNVEVLKEKIVSFLPEGPRYYLDDYITDQPEKLIVAEIIREKMLYFLEEEVPHGVYVEVESIKEREDKEIVDIDAYIYCEKESHKGIIIGKNGQMLKKIGQAARQDLEEFYGKQVFLQLWVKVRKGWRDNEKLLRKLGYAIDK